VGVEVYAEDLLKDEIHFTGRAIITLVAIDENGKPTDVPRLKLETEEDKKLFEEGYQRYIARKKRLNSNDGT
jgi:acyl-CoA hydrolase